MFHHCLQWVIYVCTVSSVCVVCVVCVVCLLQAAIKPQYVDQIPRAVKCTVQAMLDRKDERKNQDDICKAFGD